MMNISSLRQKVISTRKRVENQVSISMRKTKFYKYMKDVVSSFALQDGVIYVVFGGYRIGKSRTIRQIFDELKLEYDLIEGMRIESIDVFSDIKTDLILLDDCFISKRVENYLFYLTNKGKNIMIIANSREEYKNLRKVKGRWSSYLAYVDRKDLDLIKYDVMRKFNVNLNKYVMLNVRDIVNATLKELLRLKNIKTTIEEIMQEVAMNVSRKEMLREIINNIRRFGIEPDTETLIEIGVKVLGYQESTIRKNLNRYLLA